MNNRLNKLLESQKKLESNATKKQNLIIHDATKHPILSNIPIEILKECEERFNCKFMSSRESLVGIPSLIEKGVKLVVVESDSLEYLKRVVEYKGNTQFNVKIVNFQEDHKVGTVLHLLFVPEKDKVLHYMMSNINMTANYNWEFLQDFLKSNNVFLLRDDKVVKDAISFASRNTFESILINYDIINNGHGIVTVSNTEALKKLVDISFDKNIILKNVELW